jgi:hypothetical protein
MPETDVTVQTSLLESRASPATGKLYAAFPQALPGTPWIPKAFFVGQDAGDAPAPQQV